MRPIGVVGLGMVGETVVRAFSEVGFRVRGYDLYQGIGRPGDLAGCRVVFVCVPTPATEETGYDLKEVWAGIGAIEPHLTDRTIVAVKSTVPPGTSNALGETFNRFEFASVPEFLTAKHPMSTFMRPDRLVIGCRSLRSADILVRLMRRIAPDAPIILLRPTEAELVKLCSNALLAAKVALANELFDVCATFDVEWSRIQKAVGLDERIGQGHLSVTEERGFGGRCLPKDLDGLIAASKQGGLAPGVLSEIAGFNRRVRRMRKPTLSRSDSAYTLNVALSGSELGRASR